MTRRFTEEDTGKAKTHRTSCSTSLASGEIKMMSMKTHHNTPIRKVKIKDNNINAGKDAETPDLPHIAGGNIKLDRHSRKVWQFLCKRNLYLSSVQFSHSVVSDSWWPHGVQDAMPPCSSPTPKVHPNSHPLSRWCHPIISSSDVPFSSSLQSFPTLGSFQMSQFFALGGQSVRVSASASVLPMNTQDWSPLGWTGWISLQPKSLLQHHSSKATILWSSVFFIV